MGCIPSSTSYPGNKRTAKPAYQPGANEFEQVDSNTAVCTTHFVTCPGGNALKLVGKPNRAETQNTAGGGLAKYIQVTLPDGVSPGDVIHVRAPDGRLNAITVPEGMGPGSSFTVEFAEDLPPPPEEDLTPGVYVPTVMAEPEVVSGGGTTAGSGGDGDVVANATTGPYVPAYASK